MTTITNIPRQCHSLVIAFVISHQIFRAAGNAKRSRERSKLFLCPNLEALHFFLNQQEILFPHGLKFTPTPWTSSTLKHYFDFLKANNLLACDSFEDYAPAKETVNTFSNFIIIPLGAWTFTDKQSFSVNMTFNSEKLSPKGWYQLTAYTVQHELKKTAAVWHSAEATK